MATPRRVKPAIEFALESLLSFAERFFYIRLAPLDRRQLARGSRVQVAHA